MTSSESRDAFAIALEDSVPCPDRPGLHRVRVALVNPAAETTYVSSPAALPQGTARPSIDCRDCWPILVKLACWSAVVGWVAYANDLPVWAAVGCLLIAAVVTGGVELAWGGFLGIVRAIVRWLVRAGRAAIAVR